MVAVVVAGGRDTCCCEWRSKAMGLEGIPPCATCGDPGYKAWLDGAVDDHGFVKCGWWLGYAEDMLSNWR